MKKPIWKGLLEELLAEYGNPDDLTRPEALLQRLTGVPRRHAGPRPQRTHPHHGRLYQRDPQRSRRNGVPPIELVDSEKLISMFARAELGLRPIQTYEFEDHFFDESRK